MPIVQRERIVGFVHYHATGSISATPVKDPGLVRLFSWEQRRHCWTGWTNKRQLHIFRVRTLQLYDPHQLILLLDLSTEILWDVTPVTQCPSRLHNNMSKQMWLLRVTWSPGLWGGQAAQKWNQKMCLPGRRISLNMVNGLRAEFWATLDYSSYFLLNTIELLLSK